MSTIGGANVDNLVVPREELVVREQLDDVISDADASFEKIMELDVESLSTMKSAETDDHECIDPESNHDEVEDSEEDDEEEYFDANTADDEEGVSSDVLLV